MLRFLRFLVLLLIPALAIPFLTSCRPTEPVYPLEPRVLILSPAMNSTVAAGPITVKTYVENLALVDKAGQANVPGEGHLVYYLDEVPPVERLQTAITADGTYAISMDTRYTWPNVPPGDHILGVQIVNNDNTVMWSPSAVRVYITVK